MNNNVALGEVVNFLNSKREPLSSKQRENRKGIFPYYGASDIVDYIDDYIFDGRYLLISEDGENLRSRKTPIAFIAQGKFWVNNHAHIIEGYDDETIDYLRYYFSAFNLTPYLTGAVQPKLSKKVLEKIEIKFPSYERRKFINETLGILDDKIQLNNETNQTLENIAQALFKSWFIDFDPVRAKAEALANGKTKTQANQAAMQIISGKTAAELNAMQQTHPTAYAQLQTTAAAFPSGFDDAGVPLGWEVGKFSNLAELSTKSIKPHLEPDVMWEHYSIPAFDVNQMPSYELGETIKSNKYAVDKNAILSSKLNPNTPRTWLPHIKGKTAICSTEFMQFIPKKSPQRYYLYCLITSEYFQQEIQMRVTGSTGSRQRAQPKQVHKIDVIIPNNEVIQCFSMYIDDLFYLIDKNKSENASLEKTRNTLLPKLLNGEI